MKIVNLHIAMSILFIKVISNLVYKKESVIKLSPVATKILPSFDLSFGFSFGIVDSNQFGTAPVLIGRKNANPKTSFMFFNAD